MRKTKVIKNTIKGKNGITLIVLVITIIVLLILAGVSISMIAGDNSILQRATDAKTNTEDAEIRERIQLSYLASLRRTNGLDDYDILVEELGKEFGIKGTDWDISDEEENPWEVTVKGKKYAISPSGKEKEEIPKVSDANPGILEGSGTEADPYTINSIEDLVAFAYAINKWQFTEQMFMEKVIALGLNLDINNDKSYKDPTTKYVKDEYGYKPATSENSGTEIKTLLTDTTGEGFVPIGNGKKDGFKGKFDGQNHYISNLYEKFSDWNTYGGLFGKTAYPLIIRNLGIKMCNITARNAAGLLAQTSSSVQITNCYVTGSIIGSGNETGGFIGKLNGGTIFNSYNLAEVRGDSLTVGMVGAAEGSSISIQNCYNRGNVTSIGSSASGILGTGYRIKCYSKLL